ncbi:cytochrome c-type biogenesis protein CcmH [Pseudooceanicola antarcticus]|uniref:C-type cytochrome biogenesis protein CcmI n=1 Tax=Pseudooceanicola antarcticus TaxID=1247613 RepID=A0A285J7T8_9RHOB|nr:c-type cytochrome biogenesis protein CcmI [Pseudooceanicola antarcticus]PJE27075.1 c-type cytochrome biogenesis protein CcmI [Pseudooceanicola antarcticus]SNY56385.1 cytochrome c-type biogenesis protein CcmH [Pseudooceanicola antarcticus]
MFFWVISAILSLVVAALLGRSLLSRDRTEPPAEALDVALYRDQLAEIDRDVARGTLPEDEAARTRTEVSRRLLAADAATRAAGARGTAKGPGRIAAGLVTLLVIGGAFALYLRIGQPGYPDLPRSERISHAQDLLQGLPTQAEAEANPGEMIFSPPEASAEFAELMQKLRSAVEERPEDIRGLRLLARNEAALGNFTEAARAQARVLELAGGAASGQDHADYADMLILAAGGRISAEAAQTLQVALHKDPRNGIATYYSGLLMARTGRPDIAFRLWDGLLRSSPEDAPWTPLIRAQIDQVADLAGETSYSQPPVATPPAATAPGPSAEDIEAAGALSDEDRQQMIRGMVDGLADRLAREGGTAEEWARLIAALGVLGESDRAGAIYVESQQVFAGDAAALGLLASAAEQAGVSQ